MDTDDIIYLGLLFFSIAFGKFVRNIEDGKSKRNIMTAAGFALVAVASRLDILHTLILILGNAIIITTLQIKVIHIVSFVFSFGYLAFFRLTGYFGIPYPNGHTNLIQMMLTLKLVGLAFEVKDSALGVAQGRKDPEFEAVKVPKPTVATILHYSYCYVGLLTGPYYSYRTYLDMLNMPFSKYAKCSQYAVKRMSFLPLFGLVFLISNYYFPFDYALTDEFYNDRGIFYRIWYSFPVFIQFRMRMYIGMRLSEAVCIMAGAGCYPALTEPRAGKGPTREYSQIPAIWNDSKKAQTCEYSFKTVHNIQPKGTELHITVRNAMKTWNMSVQYWLANFVFKRFPIKSFRLLATFAVSAFWHGVYAGYYCTIISVPMYLPIEDVYYKNLKDIKLPYILEQIWLVIAFNWRMFIMGYWGITFRLLTFEASFKYWSSVYFLPHLFTFAMYGVSFLIFKNNSRKNTDSPDSGKKSQ